MLAVRGSRNKKELGEIQNGRVQSPGMPPAICGTEGSDNLFFGPAYCNNEFFHHATSATKDSSIDGWPAVSMKSRLESRWNQITRNQRYYVGNKFSAADFFAFPAIS